MCWHLAHNVVDIGFYRHIRLAIHRPQLHRMRHHGPLAHHGHRITSIVRHVATFARPRPLFGPTRKNRSPPTLYAGSGDFPSASPRARVSTFVTSSSGDTPPQALVQRHHGITFARLNLNGKRVVVIGCRVLVHRAIAMTNLEACELIDRAVRARHIAAMVCRKRHPSASIGSVGNVCRNICCSNLVSTAPPSLCNSPTPCRNLIGSKRVRIYHAGSFGVLMPAPSIPLLRQYCLWFQYQTAYRLLATPSDQCKQHSRHKIRLNPAHVRSAIVPSGRIIWLYMSPD